MTYENIIEQVRRLAAEAAQTTTNDQADTHKLPPETKQLAEELRAFPREVYELMDVDCGFYEDRTYEGILKGLLELAPEAAALDAVKKEYRWAYEDGLAAKGIVL